GEEVQVDATGDVIAVGPSETDGVVLKVSGQTGAELWRRIVPAMSGITDLEALALDADGNAVVAGRTSELHPRPPRPSLFTVLKVAGTDGDVLWSRVLDGRAFTSGEAGAVPFDARGN